MSMCPELIIYNLQASDNTLPVVRFFEPIPAELVVNDGVLDLFA